LKKKDVLVCSAGKIWKKLRNTLKRTSKEFNFRIYPGNSNLSFVNMT
jgi:hypothetical protein